MEKIIIANLKMNLSLDEIKNYINVVKDIDPKRFIVCPTNIYIPYFNNELYGVGLQNISEYNNGAYTGEVSAEQAKSMNIPYTIIGHSERRNIFNETNEIIANKIAVATKNNIKVIFCIGEKIEERESLKTKEVLVEQLKALQSRENDDIIIAYEPVWAIGTSLIPSNEDIDDAIKTIKEESLKYGLKDVKVLYGGSVNLKNIKLLNETLSDGFLIGGCSLDPENMLKIVEITE